MAERRNTQWRPTQWERRYRGAVLYVWRAPFGGWEWSAHVDAASLGSAPTKARAMRAAERAVDAALGGE